jgi:uracil-DNA glycosylase family 4
MPPTGTTEPIILVMAEAPGETEDIKGEQLVGPSGELFRPLIPEKFLPWIRWDNVVRCRPPSNRTPTDMEITCCEKFHEEDIVETRPFAIFGLGNVPLQWALGQTGITKWRGRVIPVRFGDHACWYFPFFHPAALLRSRRSDKRGRIIESDDEFATKLDIARAFELIETLPEPKVYTEQDAKENVTCITGRQRGDAQKVISFLERAGREKYAGFDYETQNLRPYEHDSRILTVAISIGDETVAFPLDHPESGFRGYDAELVRDALVQFIVSPCRKIVHNLAFEMEWTAYFFGRDKLRASRWEDTIVQAFVIDERPNCFSLEFLSIQHFGINLKKLSDFLNKKALHTEPLLDVLLYNGMDAKFHYLLFWRQIGYIEQERLDNVYDEHIRRIPTVVMTQMKGFPVDFKVNKQLSDKYTARIKEVLAQLAEEPEYEAYRYKTGQSFNPGSTRDVGILLKDIIKTSHGRQENGKYSTDEDVLVRVDRNITRLILEYRKVTKANSTYIEPYNKDNPKTVIHDDDLVHTVYQTIFTTTGRLSSDSPNVQNIVKRDSEMVEIRSQFIPR